MLGGYRILCKRPLFARIWKFQELQEFWLFGRFFGDDGTTIVLSFLSLGGSAFGAFLGHFTMLHGASRIGCKRSILRRFEIYRSCESSDQVENILETMGYSNSS